MNHQTVKDSKKRNNPRILIHSVYIRRHPSGNHAVALPWNSQPMRQDDFLAVVRRLCLQADCEDLRKWNVRACTVGGL